MPSSPRLCLAAVRIAAVPQRSGATAPSQVAGFAENQGYGLGTNAMTGEQKSLLIFGSLAAFFVLFLLGYALP